MTACTIGNFADEFERILEHVTLKDRSFLLWNEKQDDKNRGWYRKDENAVPPVYCLQPLTGDYIKYANWEKAESRLRTILLDAVAATNLDEKLVSNIIHLRLSRISFMEHYMCPIMCRMSVNMYSAFSGRSTTLVM